MLKPIGISILGLLLLISGTAVAQESDGDILVCSGDTITCTPKTCLEQCLKESDEPLDCPQVCTWEA